MIHRALRARGPAHHRRYRSLSAVRAPVPEMIIDGSEVTMCAISSLRKSEICLDELAPKLALDKSVTNRRLRRRNERDYLVNPEARRGQLAADLPGDSMPEAVKLLPRSAELVAMEVLC